MIKSSNCFIVKGEGQDFETLKKYQASGRPVEWACTSAVQRGDQLFFYLEKPHSGIVATGVANEQAKKRRDGRYRTFVGSIKLLKSPLTQTELMKMFPAWTKWKYPLGSIGWRVPKKFALALKRTTHAIPSSPTSITENPKKRGAVSTICAVTEGQIYTRQEIHDMYGGDTVSYLPASNGKIVCGCFNLDLNPDAPHRINVGDGPKIVSSAQKLVDGKYSIPVFIKRASNQWEFVGRYQGRKLSENRTEIRRVRKQRRDVVAVLHLAKVGDQPSPLIDVDLLSSPEGDPKLITHLQRERAPKLAKRKKQDFKRKNGALYCEACPVSADKMSLPRSLSEACFEVHHRQPLGGRQSATGTRLTDLAILCSNCHRMIHRTNPLMTVSAFRKLMSGSQR